MRRRLLHAYMSSVVSISLVLLLVGMACMLMLNARSVSDYFKENMEVSVIMKSEVTDDEALAYQEQLEQKGYVKSVTFISREQGETELKEMLGEDFMDVFDAYALPVSLDVTVNAAYVSSDSLEVVKADVLSSDLVKEVNYQQSLVDSLNSNFARISLVLAGIILLLLFISFVLINNTVRISVFARRFTIHTMKLVGATRSFIRKPFMRQAVLQGFISAVIANGALLALVYVLKSRFAYLASVLNDDVTYIVMGVVFVCGLLICTISTFFVVNKLVSMGKDELYF